MIVGAREWGRCVRLCLGGRWGISTKEQFLQKLAAKKYREILGIPEERTDIFREKDLHRAYLNQIKKFHSDNVTDDRKREFEEITKCIIAAYDQLKRQDDAYTHSHKNQSEIFHEEEEVAQLLFNKTYAEIKYEMYMPGNEDMRMRFLEGLNKRKNRSSNAQERPQQQQQQQQQQQRNFYQAAPPPQSDSSAGKFIALLVACGLLAIPLLSKGDKGKGSTGEGGKAAKVREYTEKEYDLMALNSKKILMKPLEQFYNAILKKRPHMLVYPTGRDPHVLEQLARYSIAPDIHLYEVSSKYFLDENAANALRAANSTASVHRYELTETKPNTLLTLSLQAERALQNVYVLVDDVVKEVRETGRFTPPTIFFKFHGYLMFEIRPKAFSSLQGYRNTKYISLFDLYFDYYSPIFFKRDHYREYLAGFEEEAPLKNCRYFGNVYLNHRSIPKVYLNNREKVVIMRDIKKAYDPSGLKNSEEIYQADWEDYYLRFEKNWKKYCAHQAEGKLLY